MVNNKPLINTAAAKGTVLHRAQAKLLKILIGFWNPGTEDVNRLISFPVITKLGCKVSRRIEIIFHSFQSGYLLFHEKVKYLWDMNHIFNTYTLA